MMNAKNNVLNTLLVVILIVLFAGGAYAFFTAQITRLNENNNIVITTDTLRLEYNGNISTTGDIKRPGDFINSKFTIKNIGSKNLDSYSIFFTNLINNVINNEYVYELTCTSYENYGEINQTISGVCSGKSETPVPTSNGLAMTSSSIAVDVTHEYILKVTFKEMNIIQNYNQNKTVEFKLNIE